jgi:hypothetical protein
MTALPRRVVIGFALLVAMISPAAAQDFRGRINGTITDNTGAVLPGVSVTATSAALIQPQTQVTGADGSRCRPASTTSRSSSWDSRASNAKGFAW